MIKALQLLLAPGDTWVKIVGAKRGVLWTLLVFLVPLLAVCLAAEGYAVVHWGNRAPQYGQHVTLSPALVMRLELVQFVTGLVMVFAGAKMIQWVGESFHFRPPFTACFVVAVYGLSPVFLVHLLNCVPGMNIWVSWALGVVGSIFVLYQGVGIVLEPEQTKGFGLYVLVALLYAMISAMGHLISLMVLQGKLPF